MSPSLSPKDFVVLVMGETGAGKSTFIKALTNSNEVVIGHGLTLGTRDIAVTPCRFPIGNGTLVLVDTPGAGSWDTDDSEILRRIAYWLGAMYQKRIIPSAIIILQRIDAYPLTYSYRKQLSMFRNLCGDKCIKNMMLVSTMWDIADIARSTKYQSMLQDHDLFWAPLIKQGSRVARFHNSHHSAIDIIRLLKTNTPIPLQIQEELVDQHMHLEHTVAGANVAIIFKKQCEIVALRDFEKQVINTPPQDELLNQIMAEAERYKEVQKQGGDIKELKKSPWILKFLYGKSSTPPEHKSTRSYHRQAPIPRRKASTFSNTLSMTGTLGNIAEENDTREEQNVEEHGSGGGMLVMAETQKGLEGTGEEQDVEEHGNEDGKFAPSEIQKTLKDIREYQDLEENGSEDGDYQSSLVEGDLDAMLGDDSEQLPAESQVDYRYILSKSRHPARKTYFLPSVTTISSSVDCESMYTASESGSRYGMMFEF